MTGGATVGGAWLQARVVDIQQETPRVRSFQLEALDGRALAPYAPGAHIDVRVPGGAVRQYSLCGAAADRRRYRIAVLREIAGRGGSAAMHEQVKVGDLLWISAPRNLFALDLHDGPVALLAAGIGITPILPMAAELQARASPFELHYCTRAPGETAFLRELVDTLDAGRLHVHHDGADPARGLALPPLLNSFDERTHLYYCGPEGFMAAVASATRDWAPGRLHSEHFRPAAQTATPGSFEIMAAQSGGRYVVNADESIADVLRRVGLPVDTLCENGVCGQCRTRYLAGVPLHNDVVLSDEERATHLAVCCARSATPCLVLDL